MKPVYILGIDTSCDDTSVAVLENDRVLASVVSSQIDVHREWGGVVPNLARREHEKMIDGTIQVALKRSGVKELNKLDAIAVTYGPGLAPALEVGVRKAKEIALTHDLPLIPVNHMEGHTLSALLKNSKGSTYSGAPEPQFPFMAMLVSGGHTEIIWCKEIGTYEKLGQTLDDAAGEAFDKIARMLDLGYPGGPVMAKLAEEGDAQAYPLPRPMHDSPDYNYSFSGLKTAALYNTNQLKEELGAKGFAKIIPDYAASVQEAIVDSLMIKLVRAAKQREPKMVLFGGGVAANLHLRARARKALGKLDIPVYFPEKKFCTDNGAMIALAAFYKFQRGELIEGATIEALDRDPSLSIEKK